MLSMESWRWTIAACVAISLCGCRNRDATTRYDVAGTVTFAGKPVPAGDILFTPDGSKNNQGPPGFAKIKDGTYDTAINGKGTVGGPHIVQISGFDGRAATELPDGMRLFPDYTTRIDLAKKKTICDFEIPSK